VAANSVGRAIHRGDYQTVLLNEALAKGADIVTNGDVVGIETSTESLQTIVLRDGRQIEADVVIGADGRLRPSFESSRERNAET
jgi:salicylate hydroxylase